MGEVSGRRVLVVDDDERVRTVVSWQLEADGFRVSEAPDGAAALESIDRDRPDLVVLDLSLPGVGGLDVLRRVRGDEATVRTRPLPVIVLSGRSGETDRIIGLDLGADDYLIKPFSPGELATRVRSVLRRTDPDRPDPDRTPPGRTDPGRTAPGRPAAGIEVQARPRPGIRVDEPAREVTVDGRPVNLTAKEFDLLAFLARSPRQVFTRAQLLQHVWSSAPDWQSEATVTEHVHRLRQKLEPGVERPRYVRTVRGVGYRLEP
jgi:two-component system, OmpR family, phosphate regulon response regulator PhoB